MYRCTVCGFDGLKRFPADHVICPCCGTQFGYTDAGPLAEAEMHALLRERWISSGSRWYSRVIHPPQDWDPLEQLNAAGFLSETSKETNRRVQHAT